MSIQVNVSPEDLERVVKDAIINSSLGTFLKKAVAEAVNSYDLKRAVEDAIKREMATMAREMITKDPVVQQQIKAIVAEKFMNEALFDKLAERALKNLDY